MPEGCVDDDTATAMIEKYEPAGSWFAWFALLSVGVPRYLFPATASSRDIFGCSKNRQNRIVENSTYPLDDFGFR